MRLHKFTLMSLIAVVVLILTGTAGTPLPSISSALGGNKAEEFGSPLSQPWERGARGERAVPQQQAENVELVGQIGGPTDAVALQGDYAYIGVGPRLVILDVSDPAHPHVVGRSAPIQYDIRHVAVSGNYAYVADAWAGLRIIDVSNPVAPFEVGRFTGMGGTTTGVEVADAYAYVAAGDLYIIDVDDPTSPSQVGTHVIPGFAEDVAIVSSFA